MDTNKRALLVGIDDYQNTSRLTGCVADARCLGKLLERHADGSPNYECRVLTSADGTPITKGYLRSQWHSLFDDFDGHILFHFSGHGTPTRSGGSIVTQDGTRDDWGLSMEELLVLASQSPAKSVLLTIDCCHADLAGNTALLQGTGSSLHQTLLREGLTILAASRATESAREAAGNGVFTKLFLSALAGGAADVRGRVSAASIYAYAEQALGPWDQRPMYKSYADRLPPVRLCKPAVPDSLLRQLPALFPQEDSQYPLDRTYEQTDPTAKGTHVALFKKFKTLRNANLLTTQAGKDLFFIALENGWVKLTSLGRFYWNLAQKGFL